MPAAEFVADPCENADGLEPKRLMQADTRWVGQRNSRIRVEIALPPKNFKQRNIKPAPHAAAPRRRVHIDGDFHAPLICMALAVARSIGVTQYFLVRLEHQPRILVL